MVSSMITNHLIKASIIEEKQRELYEYSIKSLFGNVLNIVSCLAIGVLCGECVRAIIFLLVMAPLNESEANTTRILYFRGVVSFVFNWKVFAEH